jgi:hypothetical protein
MKQFKRILTHFLHEVHEHDQRFSEIEQYICANPDAVDNQPRDIEDCIAKFPKLAAYKPQPPEPLDTSIEELLSNASECGGISSIFGVTYLGCEWGHPTSSMSCDCPYVTVPFQTYMAYKRLSSSFYNTPLKTPMLRAAFETLLKARQVKITVRGNFSFDIGQIIEIEDNRPVTKQNESITKSGFSGKWLILNVKHVFNRDYHYECVLDCASYDLLMGELNLLEPTDVSGLEIINS